MQTGSTARTNGFPFIALGALSAAIVAASPAGLAQAQPVMAAPAAAPAQVLDKARVDALLGLPDKVVFIDVRRADEISETGGVPVFLNVQITELARFFGFIPRDRQIVTVSGRDQRGLKAAALLAGAGFDVAGVMSVDDYAADGGFLYGQRVLTPDIPGVVAAGTPVEVVREGFDGTEGPISLADGSVLFTENRADRILKIALDGTVSTYLEKTGGANSLALSGKEELYAIQTAPAGLAVLQPVKKVLASSFSGKPFNRTNDLALARSGHVYFTDPGTPAQPGVAPPAVPPATAFYWLDKKGKVRLVADDMRRPNGVALSPDEQTVYVADTAGEFVTAWMVNADGSLSARRNFARLSGFRTTASGPGSGPGSGPSSGADGIVVDKSGRVLVATSSGIEVFAPDGRAQGVIRLPKQPQNLAFGGKDRSFLYVVGRGSVYRIATLTAAVDRPGK